MEDPPALDVTRLPADVRESLAQLELELSEGDITEKGFKKKRDKLLAPFLQQANAAAAAFARSKGAPSPSTQAQRRKQRRLTRNESRYHSEIRQEAVQLALAEWKKDSSESKYSALPPIRRRKDDPPTARKISDSSSDDDSSTLDSGRRPASHAPTTKASEANNNRKAAEETKAAKLRPRLLRHRSRDPQRQEMTSGNGEGALSTGSPVQRLLNEEQRLRKQNKRSSQIFGVEPPIVAAVSASRRNGGGPTANGDIKEHEDEREEEATERTASPVILEHLADRALPKPPSEEVSPDDEEDAVYVNTHCTSTNDSGLGSATGVPATNQDYANTKLPLRQPKVSHRLQQIMHSLQRPKRKPLQEFYHDDDSELESLANVIDPNAPRPSGQPVTPARGDFPVAMAANGTRTTAAAKSIEQILERHAHVQGKAMCATVLDHAGKISHSLTYGKLHSRSLKVAHMLLTKMLTVQVPSGSKEKRPLCLPGDRVALVYPNTEPLAFLTAFYGCLVAGMVPVPVEVPMTRRDAGLQQFGFLLGSCGVRVALTSEACLKGLPKAGATSSVPNAAANGSTASGNYLHSGTTGSTGSGGSASSATHLPSSSAPQNPNDVADFKGWPRLHWVVSEHLSKTGRDWKPPPVRMDDHTAYIEYSTDKEGSVKGVCVGRDAMLAHARAVVAAMGYKEGETMVSVLDFKRDVGLWHGVLAAVYAGLRVIFVPYSVMKVNPTTWMFHVSKLQATTALVKSRDLHWSAAAMPRDAQGKILPPAGSAQPMQLSSLRCVVVADGANPWSLHSCDAFAAAFHSRGLRPDAICPVAGAPETGSLSLRRPTETGGGNSGRGTLSMNALSYNVVRVDPENSQTSLPVQDSGGIVPGGLAVILKSSGAPKLCKTDEIGEICLHAPSTASGYFGLKGQTAQTFQVQPLSHDDQPLGPACYVRSGLMGFLTPDGLTFVVGNRNSMMTVCGRTQSADDLIATVVAVDSMKFVYRGRIAVFSVRVLRDERVCVVVEQKPDVTEEDAFNWMIQVIQAIDSIHQLSLYCIALVPANHLPKTPLGGLHVSETRQRFLDGILHPSTLLMCPQSAILNLPKAREPVGNGVGPAAMMVGNLVQGARVAAASGRELSLTPEEHVYLIDILKERVQKTPDHQLFTLANAKGLETDSFTCAQLLKKAERIGALLLDKGHLNAGDHVALIFPPGLDLIAGFYGCLAAGLVPVCIRPPAPTNLSATLITVRMVVDVSKAVAVLSSSPIIKLLKCKEASHRVHAKAWPVILDIDDMPSSSVARRRNVTEQNTRRPTDTCYLDFAVSTTGQLAGIVVSVRGAAMQCKSLKVACELYPSRHVVLSLDPYSGLGFALWCLASVYAGHHSILLPPAEVEANPAVWLNLVSQHKVRDTFCSYSIMEHCVRELAPQVLALREKGISLSSLRTCVAVAEERPRTALCNAFSKLFAPLGLPTRAVSTSFGSRVNTAICMQGAASPDPSVVYVDARALAHDRIALVEKGAPHSLPLMESGKLLPGVKVVVANTETKAQCADSHLGEIWVASPHNASGYYSIFGEETHLHTDHFNARLAWGDTETVFARTGYLGFLRQTESITADGELHDAVFVVGAIDETLMLRGQRYHPVDLEASVIRSHRRVAESAVFTWTHQLVVVAETDAPEPEALDLVPAITSALLEEHHLTVGVVVLVDPYAIPINSRGEKQRMHLRDAFVKDQLDPIYVAYNI